MSYHPEPTTWTVHLAAKQPGKAVVVVLVILFALFAVQALGGSWALMLLAAVLLIGAVAEFLFPVTYTFDDQGAHARRIGSHRILPWERLRRVYLRPNGIQLSPLASRGWADAFRGVMLRGKSRETLLAEITSWTLAAGVTPEIIDE